MGPRRKTIEWVRDGAALDRLLPELGPGPLAVDTEGDSLHHYPEKVCLVQLSFADRDVLLDPLAGLDLGRLGPVLGDAGLRKILHGADYDLRVFQRDFAVRIRGLFDTMIAARLVGERAFGLSALLERHFAITLDKRFQRADWSRRPLSPEMESYAAMDTRHLSDLADLQQKRLDELGRRSWAAEEFERLESILWTERVDPEAFRRVKGSARLDRRSLAVLRELHGWRESEARRRDRPPFRILHNDQLLRLAANPPDGADDLAGLPDRYSRGGAARALLEAVARGVDCAEADRPRLPSRSGRRPAARRDAAWDRFREARDRVAGELDLEPSVLATRTALEQVLAQAERGEEPTSGGELRAWQLELLRPALARVTG